MTFLLFFNEYVRSNLRDLEDQQLGEKMVRMLQTKRKDWFNSFNKIIHNVTGINSR